MTIAIVCRGSGSHRHTSRVLRHMLATLDGGIEDHGIEPDRSDLRLMESRMRRDEANGRQAEVDLNFDTGGHVWTFTCPKCHHRSTISMARLHTVLASAEVAGRPSVDLRELIN